MLKCSFPNTRDCPEPDKQGVKAAENPAKGPGTALAMVSVNPLLTDHSDG
jgi:hypothetical protein